MSVSQGMILLDVTIVNVALPSIQGELHMSQGRLEWVISAYALTLATLIPFGGTLGDRLGRKKIFLFGLVVFTIASAGCALSTSDLMLIGFRVLQGVGGAVMSALTLSILTEAYPPERRAGAIGIWAAVSGLGFGAGPIVGGILLSFADWSSIFWVNVPIGVAGIIVGIVGIQESRDPLARPLDLVGSGLCMAALFGITLGLIQSSSSSWGSPAVLVPFLTGLVLLGAFAQWERRVAHPMAPPDLLKTPGFRRSCVAFLFAYASFTTVMFYVTLLFQDVKGWSPLRTGLTWLIMNGPFLIAAQFAGRLHQRLSSRTVIGIGLFTAAIGIFGLSQVTTTTDFALTAVGYALLGAGFGLFVPAVSTAAMAEVPTGFSGIASGILNASRQVGTSIGLAVLGTIGAAAAKSAWSSHVAQLPAAQQAVGHSLGSGVAGGQVTQVQQSLGAGSVNAASSSFLHGYKIAVGLSALLLVVAAGATLAGALRRGPDAARVPDRERVTAEGAT